MKKNKNGIVFSTDPGYNFEEKEEFVEIPPKQQKLKISLDKKHRGGKTVTLITGFQLSDHDLQLLSKDLKSHCGSGGSAKDGEVIVQGDHKQKVLAYLLKEGYTNSKLV